MDVHPPKYGDVGFDPSSFWCRNEHCWARNRTQRGKKRQCSAKSNTFRYIIRHIRKLQWINKQINKCICLILTNSYPYSSADHIPCQNSSEISQTCKNHIQVTCRFHDVSQALFSSRTCIVDGKCSYQKKIVLSAQFRNDPPIWSKNTQNVVCQTIEYDDTPGVR